MHSIQFLVMSLDRLTDAGSLRLTAFHLVCPTALRFDLMEPPEKKRVPFWQRIESGQPSR